MNKEELETLRLINTLEKEKQKKLSELGIEATEPKNEESKNVVASIIKILAIVTVILGIIESFIIENLLFMIVSIIGASFIYAIGEIIDLLRRIADNTKNQSIYKKNRGDLLPCIKKQEFHVEKSKNK